MVPKIERITESYPLGEGPHWDIDSQSLYFVDCVGKNLMRYTPASQKISKASTAPKQPTFIIPVEGRKNQFIVSLDKEIAIIFWDGENDKISVVEKLCIADNPPEAPDNKFNDGKCDSSGRLWAGTYGTSDEGIQKTPPTGALYSFDIKNQLKKHVSGIHISNGLTFSEQAKKMYYVDSFKRTIDQFDLDVANGTITNRQVFFTLDKHSIPGFPDGMTIDNDDNLWVAIFGGSRILKIYGQKPETLLDSIEIPALEVTSMTFGGPNLDELYVTTAALEFDGQKPPPPANGAIYKITGTGSKGFPSVNFKFH